MTILFFFKAVAAVAGCVGLLFAIVVAFAVKAISKTYSEEAE